MKNKLLVSLLLGAVLNGLCITLASAQEEDSVRHLRWELGVDLLPLFEKSDFPDYSLFGRYLLNPGKDKDTFLRIRVGYGLESYLDTANFGASMDHSWNKVGYSLSLGFQRDISLSHRTHIYTGGDLSLILARDRKEWDDAYGVTGYEVYRTYRSSLHGLLGISYDVGSMISVSMETSLYFSLNNKLHDVDVYRYNSDGELFQRQLGRHTDQRIASGFRPFHQLILAYKF